MTKQKTKSPPLPQQQTFIKILHGLLIVSLFLMMGSGLQIYNASPVFGGKDGWRMPSWVKLGGGLAAGRDWHFTIMWVFAWCKHLLPGAILAVVRSPVLPKIPER